MSEWKERAVYTPVPATPVGCNGADGRRVPGKTAAGSAAVGEGTPGEQTVAAGMSGEALPGSAAVAPDPSAVIGADAEDDSVARPTSDATVLVRAENEDDDGYDPYSDWHDQGSAGSLFEPDPWD